MHQPSQVIAFALPSPDRLLQRVQHQLDSHRGTRTPAHNCASISIGNECDSDPARPRRHIRDAGHPQPVRRQRHEPATDQAIRPLGSTTSDHGPLDLPTTCPFQPRTAHESFDAAASHRDTFPVDAARPYRPRRHRNGPGGPDGSGPAGPHRAAHAWKTACRATGSRSMRRSTRHARAAPGRSARHPTTTHPPHPTRHAHR